jgi:hypothetical protein
MHEPVNETSQHSRQRRRELRERVTEALAAHARAAVAEAGGKIKRAMPIFSERVQADTALQEDMGAFSALTAQLGWPLLPKSTVRNRDERSEKRKK